jgi:hypothetical protein
MGNELVKGTVQSIECCRSHRIAGFTSGRAIVAIVQDTDGSDDVRRE